MDVGNIHKKFGKDHPCGSRNILADTQTDTDRQTCSSQFCYHSHGRSMKTTTTTTTTTNYIRPNCN